MSSTLGCSVRLQCIPPAALAGLCRLMAEDYRHRCGGFPDLTLWNVAEHRCKVRRPSCSLVCLFETHFNWCNVGFQQPPQFVEVKGPGDRLSEKQVVWLDVLASLGLEAEVCHVQGRHQLHCTVSPMLAC